MKRYTSTERAVLALAAVLFCGGLYSAVFPQAMVGVHTTMGPWGNAGSSPEVVSKTGARVYGVLMILVACGLAWVVNFPKKR
jgi:hypothetical protein